MYKILLKYIFILLTTLTYINCDAILKETNHDETLENKTPKDNNESNESTSELFKKISSLKLECKDLLNNALPNISLEIQKEFSKKVEETLLDLKNLLKNTETAIKIEVEEYINLTNQHLSKSLRKILLSQLDEALNVIKELNEDDTRIFEGIEKVEDKDLADKINIEIQNLLNLLNKIIEVSAEKEKKFVHSEIDDSISDAEEEIKKVLSFEDSRVDIDTDEFIENVDEYLEDNKNLLYLNIKKAVTESSKNIVSLIKESDLKNKEDLLKEFTDPTKNYLAKLNSIFDDAVSELKSTVEKYSKDKLENVTDLIRNKMEEYEKYAQSKIDELNKLCKQILDSSE